MNNKEEAEKSWTFKAIEKSQGLSYFTLPYIAGISDFKAALIQAVEKEIESYRTLIDSTDGVEDLKDSWGSTVEELKKVLELINETKPL